MPKKIIVTQFPPEILEKAEIISFRQIIGCNIRFTREHNNWSQEKLGMLSGLHPAYLGRVERGQENIGLDKIAKIARALGIELFVLFKKNSSPESSIKVLVKKIKEDMDSLRKKTVIIEDISERTRQMLARRK
jgi:transcriptional regulator with XRE-family HTH domain